MRGKAKKKNAMLYTRWGREIDRECPLNEYPRPQLKRDEWICLNGLWEYAITERSERPLAFEGKILVPFSPESLLSGVNRRLLPGQTLWYRRGFSFGDIDKGKRLILRFGAVDQSCVVYCGGKEAGRHEGGYWPFSLDITDLIGFGETEILLSVADDSDTGEEAYGKQKLHNGGIWYTAQSGIWQTVWAEIVPERHITGLTIIPSLKTSEADIRAEFSLEDKACGRVIVLEGESVVDERPLEGNSVRVRVDHPRLWSPEDPFLYTLIVEAGKDRVVSYFAMREFGVIREDDGTVRLSLNGKPLFQTGLLDQGYWSDGLYTPPSDEAMVWEISELKKLGFNMLRKHIKIEPLRWYYHCDRLGMIVWQDFVSGGGPYRPLVTQILPFIGVRLRDRRYGLFGRKSVRGREIFMRDMIRTVEPLKNSPCIAVWVPFNEGWGQFDSREVTEELRRLDPTRLIDHASGWHDQGFGDFKSPHIYYKRFRMKPDPKGRVQILSEFGGYSCPSEGHMSSDTLFGYRMYQDRAELSAAFARLYREEVIPAKERGLCASVYTQVSDVEDEINGVFTYDREKVKLDPSTVSAINKELTKP